MTIFLKRAPNASFSVLSALSDWPYSSLSVVDAEAGSWFELSGSFPSDESFLVVVYYRDNNSGG